MAVRVGPEKDYNWSYPGSNKDVPTVRVFRPTMEEFRDFNKYLEKIESQGSFSGGLSKIIPPKEWVPRKRGYDIDNDKKIANLKIPAPICQVVNGNRGIFQSINVQKRKMTVKEYKKMAESDRYKPPSYTDYEDLERKYWKNVTFVAPIYGADVNGSITDKNCKEWKIQSLGSILDYVDSDYKVQIAGVNTAYLYFGSWKSSFAWHTEDLDLHSINHLHFGASKFWYTIPPEYGRRFERLADGLFPQLKRECPAFLRHKMCLISPSVLRQNSIPYNKVVQQVGDIMITYPFGYHSGFNCGFNGAESTNFATPRWVEFGKRASRCYCKVDMVNISMDAFVKRFQPERYEKWLNGLDVDYHPADVKKKGPMSAAPPPSREEFLVNKNNSQEDIPDCVTNPNKKWLKRHRVHKGGGRMMGGVVASIDCKTDDCADDTSDTSSVASDVSKDSSDLEEVRLARTDDIDDYDYEALEDIWLKAGEVDPDDVRFVDDSYRSRRKTRGGVCGVCEACLRLNCGQCIHCRDMVTFGGAGKLGLDCERRTCTGRGGPSKEVFEDFRHAETIAANNRIRSGRKSNQISRKSIEDEEFLVKTDESSDDDEEPDKWSPRKRKSNHQSSKRKYKTEVAEKTKKVKVDTSKSVKERNLLRKKVRIKVRDGREEMKDLVRIESDSVESASNVESELDETPKLPTTPSNPSKLLPFKKPHVDAESRTMHSTKSNDNESFESEFMQWCNEKGSAIAVNMGLPSPSKSAASPPLPKKQPSSPSKPMIRVDYDKIQSPSRSPKKYDGWITKASPDDRSESTPRKINLDEGITKNGYKGSSITDAIRVACMKGKEASMGDKTERSPPAPFGGLQSTIARLMNRTNEKRNSSSSTSTLLISNGRIIQNKVNQPPFPTNTLSKETSQVSHPKFHSSPTPPLDKNKGCNSSPSTCVTSTKEYSRSLLKPAKLNPNLKLNEPPQADRNTNSDIEDVNIQKLEVMRSPNIKASKNSLAPSLSPGEDQASTTGETETEIMINKILKLLQAAGISSQPIGILERVDMGEPRQQQYLSPDKSKIHLLLAQLQHAQQLRNQLSSQHQEVLQLSSQHQEALHLSSQHQEALHLSSQHQEVLHLSSQHQEVLHLSSQHQEVLELSSSSRRMSGCSPGQTNPFDPPVSPNRHPANHLTTISMVGRHPASQLTPSLGRHQASQSTASLTVGRPPAHQPTNYCVQVGQPSTSRLPVTPLSPPCPRSPPGRQVQSPQQQSYSSLRLLLSNLSLHALRSLEHQLLLLVGSSSSLTNSSNHPTFSQTSSSQGSPSSSLSQTHSIPIPEASRSYSIHPSAGRISQTPLSHQRNLQSSSQMPPKKQVCSSNDAMLEPWTARLGGGIPSSQTSQSMVKAGTCGAIPSSQTSPSMVKAGAFDVSREQMLQLGLKHDTVNTIKPRRVE